jgi:hypothetical protein
MDEMRSDDSSAGIDVLKLIRDHGRQTMMVAIGTGLLVSVAAAVYLLWLQPVRRASVLEFRPTFEGVARGRYPNGLPFAPTDIAAGPVLDLVFDANTVSEYCSREAFRGGFFVEQRSDQSAFLDAEYQGRLAEPRLTSVERQSLQAEYEAKRAALPVQFRLVFVKPRPCAAMPQVVVTKAMTDVLATWASESETKRGVLNLQVEVLTPAVMDVGLSEEGSRLLRADLIRTALWRVVRNVEKVGGIPGAALVRLGSNKTTFAEIEDKVVDLVRSRLEPLVVSAGQSMGRESTIWITETVASAEREQKAAEGRAEAYLTALREYSGAAQTAQASRASAPTGTQGSDVQTLSPQVDRTFIDRIVEMSEANTTFRRELTESMVLASVEAVTARDRADYYRRLLQSLRAPSGSALSPAQVDARMNEIVDQAKALIADFNSLYDEFSRVSLRAAAAMYQTDKPVTTEVYREFTPRELLMLVAGTFFLTLFLAFGYFIVRDRLREAPAA